MAKTLFNRVIPLPIAVVKAVSTLAARSPLSEIDTLARPDAEHIRIDTVQPLLYVVLKSDYLAVLFESHLDLLVCNVIVDPVRTVFKELL